LIQLQVALSRGWLIFDERKHVGGGSLDGDRIEEIPCCRKIYREHAKKQDYVPPVDDPDV